MSNLIKAISNAEALAEPRPAGLAPAVPPLSAALGRPDSATAKFIEVALIVNAMLGITAASDYLARHAVNGKISQRVLSTSGRRRRSDSETRLA